MIAGSRHPRSARVRLGAVGRAALLALLAGCGTRNRPPEITFVDTNPRYGEAPVQGWMTWQIRDPDGDSLTCEIDLNGDGQPEEVIQPCTSENALPFQLDVQGAHRLTLTVTDGYHRVSRAVTVFANHCPLRPYVKQPETFPGFRDVILAEDGMELIFRDPTQVGEGKAFDIQVGDVLVGRRGLGYARIVRSVFRSLSTAGRRYQLVTEQAHLKDLVEQCFVGLRDVTWPLTEITCIENCDQVESIEGHAPGQEGVIKGGPSVSATWKFQKLPLPLGAYLEPKATFSVEVQEFLIDFNAFDGLREFRLQLAPKLTGSYTIVVPLGNLGASKTVPLGSYVVGTVPIAAGVWLTAQVDYEIAMGLQIEPKLNFAWDVALGAVATFRYTQADGVSLNLESNVDAGGGWPSASLGVGDASVNLYSRLGLYINGLVGPYVERGPEAKLSLKLKAGQEDESCLRGTLHPKTTYGFGLNNTLFAFFGLSDPSLNIEKSETGVDFVFFDACFDVLCQGPACGSTCGDGVVEGAETCDPPESCPTSCPDDGDACTIEILDGFAENCTAACNAVEIETCQDGDGCCPAGCEPTTDSDCDPSLCGNGRIDPGETCEPPETCPELCPPVDACHPRQLVGIPELCTSKCVDAPPVTACAGGDGCCPAGCTAATDSDCGAVCGNGVCEPPAETCTSCPGDCQACDPCQSVPGGNYCGGTLQFPGGDAGTLYTCSGGVTVNTEVCAYGCFEAPPGQPDACNGPPLGEYTDPCQSSAECGPSAPYCGPAGFCCVGSGGIEPGQACGSDDDCCSGNCVDGACCFVTDPLPYCPV